MVPYRPQSEEEVPNWNDINEMMDANLRRLRGESVSRAPVYANGELACLYEDIRRLRDSHEVLNRVLEAALKRMDEIERGARSLGESDKRLARLYEEVEGLKKRTGEVRGGATVDEAAAEALVQKYLEARGKEILEEAVKSIEKSFDGTSGVIIRVMRRKADEEVYPQLVARLREEAKGIARNDILPIVQKSVQSEIDRIETKVSGLKMDLAKTRAELGGDVQELKKILMKLERERPKGAPGLPKDLRPEEREVLRGRRR